MRYETIEHLKDTDFKRLTGVQHETFDLMLKVVDRGLRDFGRPAKLSRADQLPVTLMYWREYRTEFHVGQSYGVSEATVCRTIQKVENALVRSGKFRLPGKKTLQASDTVFEVVLVDACQKSDKFILVIAPEGTRHHVTEWKMGFYHIAKKAGIPVVIAVIDGAIKTVRVGQVIHLTENMEEDIKTIKGFFTGMVGINPRKKYITLQN